MSADEEGNTESLQLVRFTYPQQQKKLCLNEAVSINLHWKWTVVTVKVQK